MAGPAWPALIPEIPGCSGPEPKVNKIVHIAGPALQAILRLELYGFCLLVLAIIWFSGDRRRSPGVDMDTRLFRYLLLSTALMIITDSLAQPFEGRPGPVSRAILLGSYTLYYGFHALPLPLSILYADYQLFRDASRFPRLLKPLLIVIAFLVFLALASPFLGLAFVVDGDNHYQRGPWFPLFAASQFLLSSYLVGHIIHNRKRVNRRVFTVLAAYPIPMILASIVQTAFPGLTLLWPTMTLFVVTVAFNLENRRSKTDFLTGAANRSSLDEELERRIEAARSGKNLCGLLVDIDAFKAINDSLGHEAGDRALEDVSDILHSSVRVEDLVARMGGDEFVVLADSRDVLDIEVLVLRIEGAVDSLNASGQRPYRLSLSIGRSMFNREAGGTGADFLSILDADMYRRKQAKARP